MIRENCPVTRDPRKGSLAGSFGMPGEMMPDECVQCISHGRDEALKQGHMSVDIFKGYTEGHHGVMWSTVVFRGDGERSQTEVTFDGNPAPDNIMSRTCFDFICQNTEVS